jgi:4-hydroxybenzoate polyprenyltransferase
MTTTSAQHTPAPLPARLSLALKDIKLAHSVFALPFAVLGAFLVLPPDPAPRTLTIQLALIVACMVTARTYAMLVNRIADIDIDKHNDRTKRRAFASGALSKRDGHLLIAASALAFIAACALFLILLKNPVPLIAAAPVLAFIAFYSFTKRFTFLCHLFLGAALAISPICAAVAIDPALPPPAVLWLSAMVLVWVAGFDVIYALQDLEYDQQSNLNSVPQTFGWKRAVWIARALHLLAIAALLLTGGSDPRFGSFFAGAVALTIILLVIEHAVLATRGRAGIPIAFFTINGLISLMLGTCGVLDLYL